MEANAKFNNDLARDLNLLRRTYASMSTGADHSRSNTMVFNKNEDFMPPLVLKIPKIDDLDEHPAHMVYR